MKLKGKCCRICLAAVCFWLMLNSMPVYVSAKETVSDNAVDKMEYIRIKEIAVQKNEDVNAYTSNVIMTVSANMSEGIMYGLGGPYRDRYMEGELKYGDSSSLKIAENGWYCIGVKHNSDDEDRECVFIDCIDNTPPVISGAKVLMNNAVNGYARSGYLSVAAYDLQSGLHEEAFSFDDGESFQKDYAMEIKRNGSYCIWVRDALLNETRRVIEVNCMDNTGPVLDIRRKEGDGYIEVEADISDSAAGAAAFYYVDNASMVRSQAEVFNGENKCIASINIYVPGNYTLYAEDMLGNQTARIITIDTIPKKAEVQPEIPQEIINAGALPAAFIIDDGHEENIKTVTLEKREVILKSGENELKKENEKNVMDEYDREILHLLYDDDEQEDTAAIIAEPVEEAERMAMEAEPAFYGLERETEVIDMKEYNAAPPVLTEEEEIKYPQEADEETPDGSIVGVGVAIITGFISVLVAAFIKFRIIPVDKADKENSGN